MNKVKPFLPRKREDLLKLARMHVAQSLILEQRIKADMKEFELLAQRTIEILDELEVEGSST